MFIYSMRRFLSKHNKLTYSHTHTTLTTSHTKQACKVELALILSLLEDVLILHVDDVPLCVADG